MPQSTIDPYYLTPEWIKLRKQVVAAANHTCAYCGFSDGWQADHIKPRKRGGADSLDNLACACARCNSLVGGQEFPSFEHKKKWILAELKRRVAPPKHKGCKWVRPNGVQCKNKDKRWNGYCREHYKMWVKSVT